MNKYAYRIALIATFFVSVFLPSAASTEPYCPLQMAEGDLFKVKGHSAVYYVNEDLERMYFPNSAVYKTWFKDFSGVITYPSECVDRNHPNGGPVNFRPGTKLIKGDVSPSVYAVGYSSTLHKLANEKVASALYGENWNKNIYVLSDAHLASFEIGAEIVEEVPHEGMVVQFKNEKDLFIVKDGSYVLVPRNTESKASYDVLLEDVHVLDKKMKEKLDVYTEGYYRRTNADAIVRNPAQNVVQWHTQYFDTPQQAIDIINQEEREYQMSVPPSQRPGGASGDIDGVTVTDDGVMTLNRIEETDHLGHKLYHQWTYQSFTTPDAVLHHLNNLVDRGTYIEGADEAWVGHNDGIYHVFAKASGANATWGLVRPKDSEEAVSFLNRQSAGFHWGIEQATMTRSDEHGISLFYREQSFKPKRWESVDEVGSLGFLMLLEGVGQAELPVRSLMIDSDDEQTFNVIYSTYPGERIEQ